MVDVTIDNWEDYWTCHHEYLQNKNTASALLSTLIGALLIGKYVDRYKESQRRLQDLSIRQQNVALCLKDHYIDKTHPQILDSLNAALDMEVPDVDVDCADFDTRAKEVVSSVRSWGQSYAQRFNVCGEYGCDNELDAYGAMGAVDTAYSRLQYNRRRQERRRQLKRGIIQKAHSASSQGTGPIFSLFQNASGIYSQLFQNNQTQLAGAFQSFGSGLSGTGSFLGGIFGGD